MSLAPDGLVVMSLETHDSCTGHRRNLIFLVQQKYVFDQAQEIAQGARCNRSSRTSAPSAWTPYGAELQGSQLVRFYRPYGTCKLRTRRVQDVHQVQGVADHGPVQVPEEL